MKSRTASLRVAHQRACANASRTALESLAGCTCRPSYYTHHRDDLGSPVKGPRVRDRQVADRALRKLLVALDERRADVGPRTRRRTTFRGWAAEYLQIIEKRGCRDSTIRAYRPTVTYANAAFGDLDLADIGHPELRRVVEAIRANDAGVATVSKHLRHLGAIFAAAVDDELLAANPVPRFKKAQRLRFVGGVEAFTDEELARLWASMERLEVEPVYVAIAKAALVTGARQGELIGANLDDVDLLNGRLHIRRHYDRTAGTMTLPKDGEERTVHLIAPARALLESWLALNGARDGDAPLFPAPRGERINGQYLSRVVDKAMKKAKPPIPKVAPNGRPRKPFHGLRASFDRLMLESGRNPQWVQWQLGHSSAELTLRTYGTWSETALAAEAARVEETGFPV